MTVSTYEGVVENGQIKLHDNVVLPENSRVYVVIPDAEAVARGRIYSPRLVRPEQMKEFVKSVVALDATADV